MDDFRANHDLAATLAATLRVGRLGVGTRSGLRATGRGNNQTQVLEMTVKQ